MFIPVYYIIICSFFFFSVFTNFTIYSFYQGNTGSGNKILMAPKKIGDEAMPELTAKNFLAVDHETKTVLLSENEKSQSPIASITKLMTAIVFLQNNPAWDKIIEIKIVDFRGSGSRYLLNGDQLTIKEAFYTALVGSDNIATLALVRNSGLSEEEFIAKMNQEARLYGMNDTKFVEPTGLSPENISTAFDLSLLANKAFAYQEIIEATGLENYRLKINGNPGLVENTNKLLIDREVIVLGGKTGYLVEAGYCLISELENQSNQKIIVIILGSRDDDSRFNETKALSQWVFHNYQL